MAADCHAAARALRAELKLPQGYRLRVRSDVLIVDNGRKAPYALGFAIPQERLGQRGWINNAHASLDTLIRLTEQKYIAPGQKVSARG